MSPQEFAECVDDLMVVFPLPYEDDKENQRFLDLIWATAQCKDGRCWKRAVEMLIDQRPRHFGFPGAGDIMPYYVSAANAMKYNTEPRMPLSSDMEEVRRLDNKIYALSDEEKKELRASAKSRVDGEIDETLKGLKDVGPTVKDFVARRGPTKGLVPVQLLFNLLEGDYYRARVQQAMREIFMEEL